MAGTVWAGAGEIEDLKHCVRQWCLIKYNGASGYVQGRFLARTSGIGKQRYGIGGSFRGEAITVFDFPGRDAGVAGEIPFYASGIVPIGDCGPDWCHIRYLGLVGWVKTPGLVPETGPRG